MTHNLAELEHQAAQRAAERAGGTDRLAGHIVCDGLVRIYQAAGVEVVALQGLDLVVDRGELMAIVGASGSGKSTVLNILSGLDTPTAGVAKVAGNDLLSLSAKGRLEYRRNVAGFLWQQTERNLLPYLSARENIELPVRLAGGGRRRARSRATDLLELVGIADRADRRPEWMSGGEQQRCAIAVALANDPQVLFADEPTGELDETTAADVFGALRTINAELGVTVVVVTHDRNVVAEVRRSVAIRDGKIASEVRRPNGGEATEEFAVLDRAGRMQLPAAFVEALTLRDRVRLTLASDHVAVRPGDRTAEQ